jgi:hypothetical protein
LLLVFGGIAVRPSQMDGISGIKMTTNRCKVTFTCGTT